MRPGKKDAVAFRVDNSSDPRARAGDPGAFWIAVDAEDIPSVLIHTCPCGCRDPQCWGGLRLMPPNDKGWTISGTSPKFTCKPSIGIHGPDWKPGKPYHWHGFLTDGVFEEC